MLLQLKGKKMFLRVTKAKDYKYLQIIKGYRESGIVKQKVVANLGRLDLLERSGLEKVVEGLNALIKKKEPEPDNKNLKDISTMEELERVNYGYIAYRKLWNSFELDRILGELKLQKDIEFDFKKVTFSMVINRLLEPSSKLCCFKTKDKYVNLNEELKLQNLYRTLDILAEDKEEIELKIFDMNRNLFNLQIDIVFYDVTTYYFESQMEDDLKGYGFSKDHKINEVQVVMGLLIDKEGRPIGYELFKGNTAETNTIICTIKKLKEKFNIDNIIIVADRGLNSKINLKELKDNGFDYIVSAKIKNMSKPVQKEILDFKEYKSLTKKEINFIDETKELFQYKVLDYVNTVKYEQNGIKCIEDINEALICTYSSKRASKDKKDRERMIDKAGKIIEKNQKATLNNNKGYKKYIGKLYPNNLQDEIDNYELKLDLDKIAQEEQFDGFYAIQSSRKDIDPLRIIQNYHYLFKIEESFRVLKSTMKTRPIFHYTPKRIEGHFVMCFLAFLLERELEYRLAHSHKNKEISISPGEIKNALNSMELSLLSIQGEEFYLKSKHQPLASSIFDLLKIKLPNNLSSKEDFKKFYELYF